MGPKRTPKKGRANKFIIIEVLIAALIIIPTILLCLNLKRLIIKRIFQTIELKPDSEGYYTWLTPPTIITRGYHLFNISNPMDIVTDPSTTIVKLQETPAYNYLIDATKQDVQWSDDNKAISYSVHRIFQRHPTTFNPAGVHDTGIFVDMLRATFRTQFEVKPADAFYALGGLSPFYHRNAIEQLEGFTSPLFDSMKDKMYGPNVAKSGFIYRYNGSRSYNYTIKTGLMEKGQVLAFASENVPFAFSSPTPYKFTIYDGLTFVPMLFDKPSLNIFQADFCRPINVKFNRVVSMFGGLDLHEYIIRLVDFDRCEDPSNITTCPELDKLDISKCISSELAENTVFLSKPHFYGSSNETIEEMKIEGFTPTRDKHEALIYFEPYSGTPVRAHHRVQLNIDAIIDPVKLSEDGELVPTKKRSVRRLLPLVWIDQEVNVDDHTIRTLKMLHIAIRYGIWIIVALAVILVIIIILIIEFSTRMSARKAEKKRIQDPGNGGTTDPLMST